MLRLLPQMPIPEGSLFNIPRMTKPEWVAMAKYYNIQVRLLI